MAVSQIDCELLSKVAGDELEGLPFINFGLLRLVLRPRFKNLLWGPLLLLLLRLLRLLLELQ